VAKATTAAAVSTPLSIQQPMHPLCYRWCTTRWHSAKDCPHLPTRSGGCLLPPSSGRDYL